MNLKHITRFTYEFTNFQGWRVAIRRQGHTLTRYFSDKQYEAPEIAYEHALRFRDTVLEELDSHPENALEILTKHRAQPNKLYPAGLKPNHDTDTDENAPSEEGKSACSVRSNRVMQGILKGLCRKLQLDTASVLKLSLYLFTLQYGYESTASKSLNDAPQPALIRNNVADTSQNLYNLIEELEQMGRLAGLPSFEEFATGKVSTIPAIPAISDFSVELPYSDGEADSTLLL
ncbi:MAG: hypothetical protein IKT79_10310 [Akkermansia sp.]|nr:hypothetical protein [Akkermansia sp.]